MLLGSSAQTIAKRGMSSGELAWFHSYASAFNSVDFGAALGALFNNGFQTLNREKYTWVKVRPYLYGDS